MADKGVIVEFDYAVLNGAEVLFETAREFLRGLDGIKLDKPLEARYLAGRGFQEGLARLFASVKTKKTSQKASRDLQDAYRKALAASVPAAISQAFRNFVKALADEGVRVVLATRADVDIVRPAFDAAFGDSVVLHQENSDCYGAVRWDVWRRACVSGELRYQSALAIAGSGVSVKAALQAGMGSVGVVNGHVAYQDFGGASAVLTELSGKTAKKVLRLL